MFFEITKHTNNWFTKSIKLSNGLTFNGDLGWQQHKIGEYQVVYKGYHLETFSDQQLFESMIHDATPRYRGNFCLIIADKNDCVITHNIDRGFPLWACENCVTNLNKCGESVWADCYIKISTQFAIDHNRYTAFDKNYKAYSFEDAVNKVHNILLRSYESFLRKNKKPLKIFLSGGMDTLTAYSYLDYFTKNYELVDYEYHKFTHFYRHNWQERISKFWGYKQCHTWGEKPAVLVTGGCGDEYFMRGPHTVNIMLMHYGVDIIDLFEQNKDCYHYKYFMNYKNIFNNQTQDKNIQSIVKEQQMVKDHILNIHVNDHQHWHLDETLFFTPFKNIDIAKIMLGLPKQNFVNQTLHAEFNKALITKINPDNLKFLSKQKNYQHLAFG